LAVGESDLGVTSTPMFFYKYGAHLGFVSEEQLAELLAER